jgi:hypothetical protein
MKTAHLSAEGQRREERQNRSPFNALRSLRTLRLRVKQASPSMD